MTKQAFLQLYRLMLAQDKEPHMQWAKDEAKLDRYMASVSATIHGEATSWNHDAPTALRAYRALGGKGKMTLKALRALPES